MKQMSITTLLFALTMASAAQTHEGAMKKCYLEIGSGPANHNGVLIEAGIRTVLKNNWMASISYHDLDLNPKNLPSNYEQGYTILIFFPIPDEMPSVKMSMLNFTGGKFFELGRKTWFTAEGGVSIVKGEEVTFTSQPVANDLFHYSSNYSTYNESQTTIGGIIKADFNWAFAPYVGLSIGGFANFNSIQSPVGLELKLIAGWLNPAKKGTKN